MRQLLALSRKIGPSFLRYLLVGGLGFAVDVGGMELLFRVGLPLVGARGISMVAAIGCTYFFHRTFTFLDSGKAAGVRRQFALFTLCQLFAAALNYGVFCALIWLLPEPLPFIGRLFAVSAGVGTGLLVNFILLRFIVFPHPEMQGAGDLLKVYRVSLKRAGLWLLLCALLGMSGFHHQSMVLAWPHLHEEMIPSDSDVWMRLTEVRQWMRGGDFFDHAMHHSNAPYGDVTTPWTRPLDIIMIFFTRFVPHSFPENMRLMLAATWMPMVVALTAVAFMAGAAFKRFRHTQVLGCLVALAFLSPLQYDYLAPGNADHHGVLCMLWCGALFCLMNPLRYGTAALAGIFLGIMLWISPEALAPIGAVYALLGVFALLNPAEMKPLAALTAALALTISAALFIEVPAAEIFSHVTYDSLSIVHVTLMWLAAAAAIALAAAFERPLTLKARLLVSALGAAAVLGGMAASYPRFFLGPMVDAKPFVFLHFLPSIIEARPLLTMPMSLVLMTLNQALLAFWILGVSAHSGMNAKKKRQCLLLGALLAMTLAMVLTQARWTYYLQPVAMVTIASLLPGHMRALKLDVLKWMRKIPVPMRAFMIIAFAAFIAQSAVRYGNSTGSGPADDCIAQTLYIIQSQQLQPLLGDRSLIVMAAPDTGGEMQFFTPYRVIAANYHREGQGLEDYWRISHAQTEAEMRGLLRQRQVDAMLICPALFPKKSWIRTTLTDSDNLPGWLKPVYKLKYLDNPRDYPRLFVLQPQNQEHFSGN